MMTRPYRSVPAALVALTLVVSGCETYTPSLRHPHLATLTPSEAEMDCQQIDRAIDRADSVRWLIRDDGGHLESSSHRSARYAANVLIVPLSILLMHPGGYIGDEGHAVLDAADKRIRELLQLKRSRECAPRATTLYGLNDMVLLRELESVQAELDARLGDEEWLLKERTRLLDGLRVVPPPLEKSAVGGQK